MRVTETDENGHSTTKDFFLRPSFVVPSYRGTVEEVEKGLQLMNDGVAYHVVACCYATAYGWFRDEVGVVSAASAPQTVNTDGGNATQAAWRTLFPKMVLILCFPHGFLKIRDRCRKAFELHGKVWEVYQATSAQAFREKMESFRQWCAARWRSGPIHEALEKLWSRTEEYVSVPVTRGATARATKWTVPGTPWIGCCTPTGSCMGTLTRWNSGCVAGRC